MLLPYNRKDLHMTTPDTRPEWARNTLKPKCPACGGYMLPCTATANGVHPGEQSHPANAPGSHARRALLPGPYKVASFPESGGVYVVDNLGSHVTTVEDAAGPGNSKAGDSGFARRLVLAEAMAAGLNAARAAVFKGA